MVQRVLVAVACVLAVEACHAAAPESPSMVQPARSSSPSAVAAMASPWKAHITWTISNVQWAGIPGTTKSTFEGRCSVPSDYVVYATFAGEATHTGKLSGDGSHCTQITWTPQGPGAVTYSDGRASFTTANGSTLTMTYGEGVTGFDAATGETWFEDHFTFTGGTGLFAGASGGGKEGGRFKDFAAVLAGAPCPMWMEGKLVYSPRGM